MEGISHIAIEVSDLKRGEEFYREILGFEALGRDGMPGCGSHVVLRSASGQSLILCESPEPRSLPETGIHQAYRVAPAHREKIGKQLAARGIQAHAYREDRPAEEEDNFYFYDPDGNRIQLVAARNDAGAGKVLGIDHAVVECHDLEWAEDFYTTSLGLVIDHRVGWRTADYVRAKLWGEGKEEMAPGTRRWDQRYTVMEQKRRLPRPNTQLFLRAGESILGVYLATRHRQEPPEEQIVGTPRIGFRARRQELDDAVKLLQKRRSTVQGPIEHPSSMPIAASIYFKDPGGNFLELSVPR